MSRKRIKTPYTGVRYRESESRTYRGGPDRYFFIRYWRDGKEFEERLGWASEGWTAKKAAEVRAELGKTHLQGKGLGTLQEKREAFRKTRESQDKAKELAALQSATYQHLVDAHYMPWAKVEKKSHGDDETRLRVHLYPAFGDLPLREITPQLVESYRDRLLTTHSRATVLQVLALLRKTFNHLAKVGVHQLPNPVSQVKLPRVDNACERFFTREEFDRFIEASGKLRNPDLHDAALVAVNTGLRLGEINRLTPQDIDLANGFLTVRETDGKPGGKIPLNSLAVTVLGKRLDGHPGGPLFRTTRLGDREMSRRFSRLARKLKLNTGDEDRKHHLTFHSLRHTFASWLAMADVDLHRIQKLMRHKTFSMVQRYAHLRPSWLRSDVETLCSPPSRPDPARQ